MPKRKPISMPMFMPIPVPIAINQLLSVTKTPKVVEDNYVLRHLVSHHLAKSNHFTNHSQERVGQNRTKLVKTTSVFRENALISLSLYL